MVVQRQINKYMPRNTLALSVVRDKPTLSRQVQIILSAQEEITRSIEDFLCSTKKGVATGAC